MDRIRIIHLYDTIKFLRLIQIYYRIFYYIRNRYFKIINFKAVSSVFTPPIWKDIVLNTNSYQGKYSFVFLNLTKEFNGDIDWNYPEYGKLWAYNLNYFDFLNQEDISLDVGLGFINDYISKDSFLIVGKEPYVISLRTINWIKFLSKNKIINNQTNQILYNHYQILFNNLEFHLLGNHLLENGFSLFFGGVYFQDELLLNKSKKIIEIQLSEQILNDGGHFELSPMYHKIILNRLLDCINFALLNNFQDKSFIDFLISIASKMLAWLEKVVFSNGEIPMVNDSSDGIAPKLDNIYKCATKLGISWKSLEQLSDSGYRVYKNRSYEIFIDVGNIGPSYQPGHAHSDTFNFVMYIRNVPVFVDRGTSTYENSCERLSERSTASHNTVMINNFEQSDVWGSFRVGKRANIIKIAEGGDMLEASHDGYKKIGVIHNRKWSLNSNSVLITDSFVEKKQFLKRSFYHLHPSIKEIKTSNQSVDLVGLNVHIKFCGEVHNIAVEKYPYAIGFNKTLMAIKLIVSFSGTLDTIIEL